MCNILKRDRYVAGLEDRLERMENLMRQASLFALLITVNGITLFLVAGL